MIAGEPDVSASWAIVLVCMAISCASIRHGEQIDSSESLVRSDAWWTPSLLAGASIEDAVRFLTAASDANEAHCVVAVPAESAPLCARAVVRRVRRWGRQRWTRRW